MTALPSSNVPDVSPYVIQALRRIGKVYRLTDEERCEIINAAQEFAAVIRCTDGAPLDRRLHLRTFFALLRDYLKNVSVADALEQIDYAEIPAEQEHWRELALAETRHVLELQADWQHSRGVK